MSEHTTFGYMARFDSPERLLWAVREAREAGYAAVEAYAPMPVEGLAEALGSQGPGVAFWILLGGVIGGGGMFWLQWYSAVVDYPINVGGRPLNSWPAFIFISVEVCLLSAVVFGVAAMLIKNRLPRLYHPIFNVEDFDLGRGDAFYLCIESADPAFDRRITREFLLGLSPLRVEEVPP